MRISRGMQGYAVSLRGSLLSVRQHPLQHTKILSQPSTKHPLRIGEYFRKLESYLAILLGRPQVAYFEVNPHEVPIVLSHPGYKSFPLGKLNKLACQFDEAVIFRRFFLYGVVNLEQMLSPPV